VEESGVFAGWQTRWVTQLRAQTTDGLLDAPVYGSG
jgi:hypothetical protein